MIAYRKTDRPASGRRGPTACLASVSVSLASAVALLTAPLLPARTWAQSAAPADANASAVDPPTATLTGRMTLATRAGDLPRLVPVTLTPQGKDGYDVHYQEQFRCHVRLTYNGHLPNMGHLYTASVVGTASGGMSAYCATVGAMGKPVLLRPRTDGLPGYSYEDQAPTGRPVTVVPTTLVRPSP